MVRRMHHIVLASLILISVSVRVAYWSKIDKPGEQIISWDALGYYVYNPAVFVYKDIKQLNFYAQIEKQYHLQGDANDFYQFRKIDNGNYVGKYFIGVSLMQLPFFVMAHTYCLASNNHPADGFSYAYKVAIAIAGIFYLLVGLYLLYRSLLLFFNPTVTSITLIIIAIGTNLLQYSAVEGGQVHVYIFALYAWLIYATSKFHITKKNKYVFQIALAISWAIACRPTEMVSIFIPLLWNASSWKDIWQNIKNYVASPKKIGLIIGSSIPILLQMAYWKYVSNHWIFDVGSKWDFFNPHWRVLFGGEKGWFVYTPLTLLLVIGLLFIKNKSFGKSVLVFSLLNLWVIIAWHIWQYGASYSCRALVQSYPVWAMAMASVVELTLNNMRYRKILFVAIVYFSYLNIFQIAQYNAGIIHYSQMNFKQYAAVYWRWK